MPTLDAMNAPEKCPNAHEIENAPDNTLLFERHVPQSFAPSPADPDRGNNPIRRVGVIRCRGAQGGVMIVGFDGWHCGRDFSGDELDEWRGLKGAIANEGERECVRLLMGELADARAEVAALKAERATMVPREVALEAAIHAWSHGRLRFAGGGYPQFKLNPQHIWKEGVGTPGSNEREYREACECAEVALARAEAEAAKPQTDKEKSDADQT